MNILSNVIVDLACPVYTETTKAICIQYTEKKCLIRDLSDLRQITCEALSERKSSQVIVKGHYTSMPPKLHRFNVGLFNKIKKQERDAALCENTKLMNSVAEESRKLKSIQMKLKRLQITITTLIFILYTDLFVNLFAIDLFILLFPIHTCTCILVSKS